MTKKRPLLFSTASYDYLREAIARRRGFETGQLERKMFPDGEHYQRILSDVEGRDVIIVGGTITNDDTMDIFDLGCGLVKYGAETLVVCLPVYGYSTMERAVKPGEIVTAKSRARLLSAIPQATHGNRVLMLDLHTEGITHYFEGDVTPKHIDAAPLILAAAKKIAAGRPFVLASTDAGRAKRVEALAKILGVPPAFAFKARLDGATVESRGVSGPVKGALVIIYDDMIRTGGSLIKAGQAYKDAGAAEIVVISTHGLFPSNALETLKASGLFTKIVTTDSHPNAVRLADGDFLTTTTAAGLLATVLKSR